MPNALTLANLACGSIAAYHIAHSYDATPAVYLIFLAAFFDLLDGAAARKIGVSGDMGRELDSLADVVSFGLVPSLIIYCMLERSLPGPLAPAKYLAFFNVVAAAYRLARFNVSESTGKTFNGMPSPANGIFWASLLAISFENNAQIQPGVYIWNWPSHLIFTFLIITSLLMVSRIEMFSFKFRSGGIAANKQQALFAVLGTTLTVGTYLIFGQWLFVVPMLILLYIAVSVSTFLWKSF